MSVSRTIGESLLDMGKKGRLDVAIEPRDGHLAIMLRSPGLAMDDRVQTDDPFEAYVALKRVLNKFADEVCK